MKIIGFDASTTCTGYGVFDGNSLINYGCFKPKGASWKDRLIDMGPMIKRLLEEEKPNKIIMEDVPLMNRQMSTLVILGAVQGYIIGIAASLHIPIEFVMPTTWRSHAGLYDGTKKGMNRDVMKEKAVKRVNEKFGLELEWHGPKSTRSQDDIAEAILLAWSQIKIQRDETKL